MNQGIALYCPNCASAQKNQYGTVWPFGSISPSGAIIIKRKAQQNTIILMTEGTIVCNCGYSVYYDHGTVSMEVQPSNYHYEHQ